jgi:quinol-cytochrome oxidoreductase complex cytochrome b subunit
MTEDRSEREKAFYPFYLSEILIVISLVLGAVFVLAMLFPPQVGREINFISAYQPKPEWYFLWLYQLVRYFPGKWAFTGTVVIPLVAAILYIFLPLFHRGTARSDRVVFLLFTFLGGVLFILTLVPLLWP